MAEDQQTRVELKFFRVRLTSLLERRRGENTSRSASVFEDQRHSLPVVTLRSRGNLFACTATPDTVSVATWTGPRMR